MTFNGGTLYNDRLNKIFSGQYSINIDTNFKTITKEDYDYINYCLSRGKIVVVNVNLTLNDGTVVDLSGILTCLYGNAVINAYPLIITTTEVEGNYLIVLTVIET